MKQKLPQDKPSRKQLFRAALAIAGMTGKQWADEHDVTREHLWHVLSGSRESRSLTDTVDAFIAKHLVSVSELVA